MNADLPIFDTDSSNAAKRARVCHADECGCLGAYLQTKDDLIQTLRRTLSEFESREELLVAKEKDLAERTSALSAEETYLAAKEKDLLEKEKELREKEQALWEKERDLAQAHQQAIRAWADERAATIPLRVKRFCNQFQFDAACDFPEDMLNDPMQTAMRKLLKL